MVGVTDARMGEEICACITVKDEEELTEDDVKTFCRGKVSFTAMYRHTAFIKWIDAPYSVWSSVQSYCKQWASKSQLNCSLRSSVWLS